MKLLDANILLYAVNEDAPLHGAAKSWVDATLSGSETIGLTWTVLLAFLRLSTRAVIFPRPLAPDEAFDIVESWLEQPCVTVLQPTDRHFRILRDLLEPLGTAGNLTSDAHLAAIALEHDAELCSCDADFARFAGVRWVNPIAP